MSDKTTENFVVWEIGTGKKLRTFTSRNESDYENFKWSYNGDYIARINLDDKDKLFVYELPSMNLTKMAVEDKKGKAKVCYNICNFIWSPVSAEIAYACCSP